MANGNRDYLAPFVPAHSRPKDGVASLAYERGPSARNAESSLVQNWIPAFAGMNG